MLDNFKPIERLTRELIYWTLQPCLIVMSLYLAHTEAYLDSQTLFVLLVLCLITLLEAIIPARPEWQKSIRESAALFGFVFVASSAYAVVEALYEASLFGWLANISKAWQLNIWPSQWPILAQVLLIFAAFEFINYWYHRAAHRWGLLWKLSGHGVHHSFKKLSGSRWSWSLQSFF